MRHEMTNETADDRQLVTATLSHSVLRKIPCLFLCSALTVVGGRATNNHNSVSLKSFFVT